MKTYYIFKEKDSYRVFENEWTAEEYYKDNIRSDMEGLENWFYNLTVSVQEDAEDKKAKECLETMYEYCQSRQCDECVFGTDDEDCYIRELYERFIERRD